MQKENVVQYLSDTLSFWKEITEKHREEIMNQIAVKSFKAGDSIKGSSRQCAGLFLIRSGQVRAYIVSESGKEITLYRLFDRDTCIFSASCMMRSISFDILIEVEKDTEAYLIPSPLFKRLSEESLPLMAFTNQLMAARFTEVMWILEQALFMSFDKRLAMFLQEQAVIEGSNSLKITHERIANHMGSAREVVTRMLKYFQGEGVVRLGRGTIEILDEKKLEAMID